MQQNSNEEQSQLQQNPDNVNEYAFYDNGVLIDAQLPPLLAGFLGLLGSFLLYHIIGALLTISLVGVDVANADPLIIRLTQITGQVLFILVPAFLFTRWIYGDITTILRFRAPKITGAILFSLGMIVLIPLLNNFITIQNYAFQELAKSSEFVNSIKILLDELNQLVEDAYKTILSIRTGFDAVLVFLLVAITPAVCEETMFRGFIQKSLEVKFTPFLGALITAVFFSLYHFNPYGFIALVTLGTYFGFAAYKTNSIFVPMILHFLNNLFAALIYYFFEDETLATPKNIEHADFIGAVKEFILLGIIFVAFLVILVKYYKIQKLKREKEN